MKPGLFFLSGFVSFLGGTVINSPNMSVGKRVAILAVIGAFFDDIDPLFQDIDPKDIF